METSGKEKDLLTLRGHLECSENPRRNPKKHQVMQVDLQGGSRDRSKRKGESDFKVRGVKERVLSRVVRQGTSKEVLIPQ